MTSSKHEFDILTPCFAGGVEPSSGLAELRPASIRGLLRWWFRVIGGTSREEAEVFGCAAGSTGSASSVIVRVSGVEGTKTPLDLQSYTGTNSEAEALRHPESYFLWPLRTKAHACLRGNAGQHARFDLHIAWRKSVSAAAKVRLENTLNLWSVLGATGSRSLKGYGSVWPRLAEPMTEQQLTDKLTVLPPNSVRLWRDRFTNPQSAIEFAAGKMREMRCGTTRFGMALSTHGGSDHNAAADVLNGTARNPKVYRPVLGLPLKQSFDRGARQVATEWNGVSRLASPLHIKVGRLNTGYCLLLVFFESRAISQGARLALVSEGNQTPATLDWGLWNLLKSLGRPLR